MIFQQYCEQTIWRKEKKISWESTCNVGKEEKETIIYGLAGGKVKKKILWDKNNKKAQI